MSSTSTSDIEVANTLPPDEAAAPGSPAETAPVANWDRYELLELLGTGGMGSVYKARDPRLGRTLAIKFIRGADPNLTMRLLREARAQARIDHPNVCRVYEAGEVEHRAYIALQFVDGEPLSKAAARMSLDEKIAVLRDVAVAVHEAHRLGIVHRDLKPGNVLVERTEQGLWLPVVMDFGLAREATVEIGITESGMPLGTPAYMSPEQARGDIHAIDRRSDVYSLGATLYELLTGSVPFPDTSLALVLLRVLSDDPPAPRSLVPSLPIDLETIALKCLAKDPTQRYPSARALADDLGRYLDGAPILGRRLSLWQRARLRARRHRALVVLGACSLAIIVALAALGIRASLISAERSRLAERLGREATEIEGSLRVAMLLPLHDTRPDRERVRERMRAIAATPHGLEELGDDIVHNALGRGHLALHEWREAADELAAVSGQNTPELHAARGRALGELYRRALDEARRALGKGDPVGRAPQPRELELLRRELAQLQRELAQRYLTKALQELEASRAAGDAAGLLEAQIALYRRDFAAAERKARAVADGDIGSSEARKLAGDAAYGAAVDALDRSEYDAARAGLEHATALYAEASEIARSDASVYEAAAQAWLQLAEIDFLQGRSPRASLEHALEVIDDHALRADPDDAAAYTTKAYVLLRWYRTRSIVDRGDEPAMLDRAAEAATRAVAIDRQDAQAWISLGHAQVYRCIDETGRGGDGAMWCRRALDAFHQAVVIEPGNPRANNGLGTAHRWLGTSLGRAGRDPTLEYEAALHSYERATAVAPNDLPACTNQVDLEVSIAEYDHAIGVDPRSRVDAAQRMGERCLAIDANYFYVLEDLARAQLTLARYLVDTGGDPRAALDRARHYIDRDDEVHPGYMSAWYFRLAVAAAEARFQLHHQADPTSSIASGRTALTRVLGLAPESAIAYVEAARLDLVEAAWAARTQDPAAAVLARALGAAEKAIALDSQLADADLVAAEVCLQIATAQRSATVARRGLDHVTRALTLNPRLAGATALRDALSQLAP